MNSKFSLPCTGWLIRLAAIALMFCGHPAWGASPFLTVDIELKRLDGQNWRAAWTFSEPVNAVRVYPARLGFRQRSWHFEDAGLSIEETDQGGVIRHKAGPISTLAVRFTGDSDFEDKTYVPVLPFSDGGAAVYTGHFSADVLDGGEWRSAPTQFSLTGREQEHTLLPAWASELNPVYAYVGPQQPLVAGGLNVIADADMPPWLTEIFEQTVPRVTAHFTERLGFALDRTPLVFIAAGELRDSDGYSVKGAGLDGQFTVMLRGTGLLIGSAERRRMFEKMLAHELLHIWQQAMPGGDFNPGQPWLHEGSADALAIHALHEIGAWSAEELEEFHETQRSTCRQSLGESTLETAAESGNWTAIYACGYLEFTEDVPDPFALWRALVEQAEAAGSPYSMQMLQALRSDPDSL